MAEKTLNTRIINKHAELSVWNTSTLALKTGEIALARVETTKPDGHGGFYTVPTYLMKVGDGNKKFNELQWLAAPASDVYEWAKKASMSATDIPVFTADDAARIAPTFATAIANLQQAVGSGGSVNEMIQTAIEALDVTDTEVGSASAAYQVVTAVSETDGKITVTRRSLAIKDIEGLQAALDAKLAVATYTTDKAASDKLISDNTAAISKNAEDIAAVKATADAAAVKATVDQKFGEVDEAVAAAQADATSAHTKLGDGFSSTTTVASEFTAVKASVTKEAEDRAAADSGLDTRIQSLEGRIGELSGAMHFKGVKDALPTDYTGYVNGDVIIVGNKEYVYDSASTTKFVEFGDVDDVTGRVSTLEGKVGTLETNSATKSELEAAQTTLQGNIDKKADQSALDTTNGNVTAAQNAANAAQADATSALEAIGDSTKGLTKDVNELKTNSATKAQLEAAQTTLQGNIDKKADQSALDTTNGNVTAAQNAANAAQADATDALNRIGGYDATNTVATDITGVKARISKIEEDYLTAADTYIFDCGGAE